MTQTAQIADPVLFREFPFNVGMRLLAPANIRSTAQQRDAYRRFTQVGDRLADDLVEAFRRLPAGVGRQQFETAVEQGIDAVDDPLPELVAFFAQVDARPYWVDQHKLDLAARVLGRIGVVAGFTSLAMLSLMGGYLASRADKTLVATGDLDQMAPRRLAETLAWTVDVTGLGALGRYETGFKGTVRVRLMHAMVRAGINRRPDWNYADWDQPVNQSTLAGTLLLFSLGNVVGSQALGLRFSRREKDAIYHLWRYIGYAIGVDVEILPTSELDTWRLLWLQADYEFRPDEDSRGLAQALAKTVGPLLIGTDNTAMARVKRYIVTNFLCSYSRLILGKSNADALGLIDNTFFQALVVAVAGVNHVLEYPRLVIPWLARRRERIGRRNLEELARRTMARHNGDRTYRRHDRLGVAEYRVMSRDSAQGVH
jgi:ER-bound oxygenase mpaB/B'/Rubber oxygenase, catalytic domain